MPTQQRQDRDSQPWYRQFWFWFLMTPLIAVVFVVAVLLTVAFYNADDVVLDNYYREGRGVNQVFEQDIRAQQLALSATLNFDRMSGEVLVDISANEALPEQLLLLMDHCKLAVKHRYHKYQLSLYEQHPMPFCFAEMNPGVHDFLQ